MAIRLFKSRKAVSPLIATVLLIAFAVALGAVVMNWGRGYVEDTAKFAKDKTTKEIKCSIDVGLDFITIGGRDQICYMEGDSSGDIALYMLLANGPSTILQGVQITYIGEEGVNITMNDTVVAKAGVLQLNVTDYDNESLGDPRLIQIVPIIEVEGSEEDTICSNDPLEKEDLKLCSEI